MENEFDDPFADDETNADRFVIYVNNRQKEIKNYQIDPVNHETIVYISTRGKKWIPPAEPVGEDRLENDNYFNAAPADFPAGILSRSYDPITGVYIVHPQLAVAESAEPEDEEDYCDSDDDDLNSVYSLDENNVNQKRSFNKRIYTRVLEMNARVDDLQEEIENNLKSLVEETNRNVEFQDRITALIDGLMRVWRRTESRDR